MSGMLQHIYEACCMTSLWADESPEICGCRGRGWMLSDLDTWHKCCVHQGPHPMEDELRMEAEEWELSHQSREDEEGPVTGKVVNHIEVHSFQDDLSEDFVIPH